MNLKDRITTDMKDAMRARDRDRLGTIRMLQSAIQQREVDERSETTDAMVLAIVEKMVKQRRESVDQYRAGGRDDLADREEAEIEILSAYLPEPLSEAELDALVEEVVTATGAESMKDMGKVMGELKARAQGRADMAAVSAKVKGKLG